MRKDETYPVKVAVYVVPSLTGVVAAVEDASAGAARVEDDLTGGRAEVEDTTGAGGTIDEVAMLPPSLGNEDSLGAPPAEDDVVVAVGSMELGSAAEE